MMPKLSVFQTSFIATGAIGQLVQHLAGLACLLVSGLVHFARLLATLGNVRDQTTIIKSAADWHARVHISM